MENCDNRAILIFILEKSKEDHDLCESRTMSSFDFIRRSQIFAKILTQYFSLQELRLIHRGIWSGTDCDMDTYRTEFDTAVHMIGVEGRVSILEPPGKPRITLADQILELDLNFLDIECQDVRDILMDSIDFRVSRSIVDGVIVYR